eukprot:g4476.t1
MATPDLEAGRGQQQPRTRQQLHGENSIFGAHAVRRLVRAYWVLGIGMLVLIALQRVGTAWLAFLSVSWLVIGGALQLIHEFLVGSASGDRHGARRPRRRLQLSEEAVRLLLTDRDFDAEDYEQLLALDRHNVAKSTGATGVEIARLPVVPFRLTGNKDERCCPICLEALGQGESVRVLPCLHKFHPSCIDKWLQSDAICPVCKFPAVG